MNVLPLMWYGTSLLSNLCRWHFYGFSMLRNEVSSGFRGMTPAWFKVAAEHLFRSCLAFAIVSINTAFCQSNLVALLIAPVHIWHVVAQWKSIGRLLKVYTISFHTVLPTVVYKTWLKRLFHHERETQGKR